MGMRAHTRQRPVPSMRGCVLSSSCHHKSPVTDLLATLALKPVHSVAAESYASCFLELELQCLWAKEAHLFSEAVFSKTNGTPIHTAL
jgi:hypothetical protein